MTLETLTDKFEENAINASKYLIAIDKLAHFEDFDDIHGYLSDFNDFITQEFDSKTAASLPKNVFIDERKLCFAVIHILTNYKTSDVVGICTDILHKIIAKNGLYLEAEKLPLIQFLTKPENFAVAFRILKHSHSVLSTDLTKSQLRQMHLRVLKILENLHFKRPRYQFSAVSEEDIEYILHMAVEYKDMKEHVEILLTIIKQISRTKKFCKILGRKEFFDALLHILACTQQSDIIARIIRIIFKNGDCLGEMKQSINLCYVILDLVNNFSRARIMKKHLIGILYKILKAVPTMISLQRIHNGLIKFLENHNNLEEKNFRMTIIKVYTLMNLQLVRKIMPSQPFNHDFKLPSDVEKTLKDEIAVDSDNDNTDEDEFDNEDDDYGSNEDSESSDDDGSIISSNSYEDIPVLSSKTEISNKKKYFLEFYTNNCQAGYEENLDIFDHIYETFEGKIPNHKNKIREVIFDYVRKPCHVAGLAYPDLINAESIEEEKSLDFRIHQINFARMVDKLNKSNKNCQNIVYNLDDLLTNFSRNIYDISRLDGYDSGTDAPFPKKKFRMTATSCKKDAQNTVPALEFESRFESGNLRRADQIDNYEYNLFLTPDTSTIRGHRQWFYFQVCGMIAGKPYTFNIVDFEKINSQFNYGMQPVMFSITSHLLKNIGWFRTGEQVLYYGNNYTNEENTKLFRTLTFTITFEYNFDYCYIAYHYPYTYTSLMAELYFCKYSCQKFSSIYNRVDDLCTTLNHNTVPLVTITSKLDSALPPYEERPLIFIAARVHPGETNSSWIMQGILKCLYDENDEYAAIARNNFIFKIIPMLNPDGCIFGNTRSGLTGCDLNRCWQNPGKIVQPEIYHTKKLVEYAKKNLKHPIAAFIDIHGHSRKKYFFFYGCNPASSWNKRDKLKVDNFDYTMIPSEISANKNMKQSFCHYRIDKYKEATARVVMWREFGIKNSLTLECSYCSGYERKKITTRVLQDIGKSIIVGLAKLASKKKDMTK